MNDIIEVIKLGGPVLGVCFAFLYYIDRMDKRTKVLVENHLSHLTEAMNKNTVVLERLATLLDRSLRKRDKK